MVAIWLSAAIHSFSLRFAQLLLFRQFMLFNIPVCAYPWSTVGMFVRFGKLCETGQCCNLKILLWTAFSRAQFQQGIAYASCTELLDVYRATVVVVELVEDVLGALACRAMP